MRSEELATPNRTNHKDKTKRCRSFASAPLFLSQISVGAGALDSPLEAVRFDYS